MIGIRPICRRWQLGRVPWAPTAILPLLLLRCWLPLPSDRPCSRGIAAFTHPCRTRLLLLLLSRRRLLLRRWRRLLALARLGQLVQAGWWRV